MYLYKINPFYKCVGVMSCAIILSFTYSAIINICVFSVSMALILTGSDKYKAALKLLLSLFPLAAGYMITGLYFGGGQETGMAPISVSSFDTGINLATRIFAFAGLGMLFSLTTNPYDFMKSLQKDAGLSRRFAYGILCAFSLMPYITSEFQNAKLALRVRGVGLNPFSFRPVFSTLVNCVRWSEALSIAMQSKGFCDNQQQR